jgi:hypothetical protein
MEALPLSEAGEVCREHWMGSGCAPGLAFMIPISTTFDENTPAGNSHLPKFYAGHAWPVQLCRAAEAVIRDFISFVSRKADL